MTALHDWPERRWQEACPVELRDFNAVRPGYFRIRLVAYGPWLPARIWLYRPRVAGTDHLAAHIAGEFCDPTYLWQHGREITEELYRQLMAQPPANPSMPVIRRRGDAR